MKAILVFPCVIALGWGQWSFYGVRSLTADIRAGQIGDVLTILVVEESQASNTAQTSEQRRSELSLGAQGNYNRFGLQTGGRFHSGSQFHGRGETSRSERIRARLTVQVVGKDTLGNLIVEGQRVTRINGEEQNIRVRGKVRPIDIGPDNTVPSYALSELVCIYEGDGSVSRAQEPGLIARLLRLLF
ncbi:MAG: flagellar basal body L-ring protein FlgH [Candidatus Kapabacteria bacterium]|nr:flagellar basal body L-ring protein FlgH [Candidatus Kapabacteria bacterium]MDW8224531.1 flagellar basal body L-ring protein FlgH [Bacteroidota bacterium]